MKKFICLLCMATLVCACAQTKKPAPKEGRIAVQTQTLGETVSKSDTKILLTKAVDIENWHQTNINAQNKLPHAQISGMQKKVWSRNVGNGISSNGLTMAHPIIANDVIYTLDSRLLLTAVQAQNGKRLWEKQLPIDKHFGLASIGLAFSNDTIYAVSGDGTVYAINPQGEIIWQKRTGSILRSAPLVTKNKLYILSGNNELVVLNTKDGEPAWNYKNISTSTNLMGMGLPAADKNTIIAPFSTGEIVAFDATNGLPKWSDTLLSYRTFNQISDLTHVLAAPVIENNTVYLIGNANRMGAFNLSTGEPIFIQPIAGKTTPVISGNTLFMISNKNKVIALDKTSGALIWEQQLLSKEQKKCAWFAPVLANNQLIITSTAGDVLFVDAISGEINKKTVMDELAGAPIINGEMLIFYTTDADLIAYK